MLPCQKETTVKVIMQTLRENVKGNLNTFNLEIKDPEVTHDRSRRTYKLLRMIRKTRKD
jgi:hypothetical protein